MTDYAGLEFASWLPEDPPIRIPGLDGMWKYSAEHHYDYEKDKSHCPVCGSVGIPWGGWFSCDGGMQLSHVAVVKTGDVYVRTINPEQADTGEKR
jgi:hypothetical protein